MSLPPTQSLNTTGLLCVLKAINNPREIQVRMLPDSHQSLQLHCMLANSVGSVQSLGDLKCQSGSVLGYI